MKKFIIAALVACLALTAVTTQSFAAIEVEGDAYIGVFDKYLWRGYDLSGSMPVAQGGVDITAGDFTLSYWTNVQLANDKMEGFKSGEGTETDIVIDYSKDINDLVSISVGDIYYMLDGIDDTHELYLSLSLSTILEPSFSVYYDWDEAREDGLFYTASVGHTFEINDDLSVSLGALVSYNQESDYSVFYTDPVTGNDETYSDWHNYELSVGVDYAVTDQITVSPSFLYSSGISDEAKIALDSETVGGVTVTFTF